MRMLTIVAAVMSLLTLISNRKPLDLRFSLLFLPKALAGGLTPLWVVFGAAGVLFNLLLRRPFYVLTGLLAVYVSGRHIKRVTRSQDYLFDGAFGRDWQKRIPPERTGRMLANRYTPIRPNPYSDHRWQRQIVYGRAPQTGDDLLCDIWQGPVCIEPSGLGIIYLHGSAWHYMDKDFLTRPFFRHLASQGHLVMDAAYTLAPQADIKEMTGDVKRAIAWLKENSERYGVNPERIVLMGGSAGGHLSLLAGYTPNLPELQPADVTADTSVHAVVCYYGFADMVETYYHMLPDPTLVDRRSWQLANKIMKGIEPWLRFIRLVPATSQWEDPCLWFDHLFGGTPDTAFEVYKMASPISHVNADSPPTLFIQGADDIGGMVEQIKRLKRILHQEGVTAVYLELPNTDHAFDILFPRISPAAQTATYYVERFLALVQ
jgi:acetyl esterase/lipase